MIARKKKTATKRPIESYEHKDKRRVNNPPVGLVTPGTDPDAGAKTTYAYDPHLDPQLVWAGKAEHTSFEVPTVSLHVHERIDPRTIIEAVRKRNGNGQPLQMPLFEAERKEPLPDLVLNAYYLLGYDWREAWRAWRDAGPPTPPVMITVCNRTETAARVKHAFDSRRIPIDELCDSERILHIDSKVLDEAEAQEEPAAPLEAPDGGGKTGRLIIVRSQRNRTLIPNRELNLTRSVGASRLVARRLALRWAS